jgi:hypothetical protein
MDRACQLEHHWLHMCLAWGAGGIHLIDLICYQHKVVLLAKPHNALLVGLVEALACGVPGIDDHQSTHTKACTVGSIDLLLQVGNVQAPACAQVISTSTQQAA